MLLGFADILLGSDVRHLVQSAAMKPHGPLIVLIAIAAAACAPQDPAPPAAPSAATTGAAAVAPMLDDAFLEQMAATHDFSLGRPTDIAILPDGSGVLFRRSGPRSITHDLYYFDVKTGAATRLLSADDLLGSKGERVSTEEKARRERMRLITGGITRYAVLNDGRNLLVSLSGDLYLYERETAASRKLPIGPGFPITPQVSPDGRAIAMVRDSDLWVLDIASGKERRLTERSSDREENATAEFVAQEEMGRYQGYWWSPDGNRIAYQHTDLSNVETVYVANAANPKQAPTPFRYPRAGTPNADVTLGIVPVSGGKTVWADWDRAAFPYLATATWPARGPLTIVVQNRAQTDAKVLAVDAETGKTRELVTEHDDAWLNIDRTVPAWLPDGSAFLWSSERSGAWELELRRADGRPVRTLAAGALGYRRLAGVDAEHAWVVASDDPRKSHILRIPIAGGAPIRTTEGDGIFNVSLGGQGRIHTLQSRLSDGSSRVRVVDTTGKALGELPSVAEVPPYLPKPELTTIEFGGRNHYAAIVRPRDFDKSRRYPVLLYVYGAPIVTVVSVLPWNYLTDQLMADSGFIVVRLDGRATPGRGRAWERAHKGNIVTIPLADQADGVRALCAAHPEMDPERVGIFGWSFGGYLSVMAAELRPDVFKAAVSGAAPADWRDYDTHGTERYMGLPFENAAGYTAASPLTRAAELRVPLLLIHGTGDDNVHFMHALKLSDAFFRAGKPFELLPLLGSSHRVTDPAERKALEHRIVDFFRKHLGPPEDRSRSSADHR